MAGQADRAAKAQSDGVTKGKRANLILLNENPLVNISNTLSIAGVFKGEDWIPRNILKYMYSEARKSLSKAPLR